MPTLPHSYTPTLIHSFFGYVSFFFSLIYSAEGIEHSPEMDLEQSFDSSHEDQSDELVDVMSFEEEDFDVTNEDLGLLQTGTTSKDTKTKQEMKKSIKILLSK